MHGHRRGVSLKSRFIASLNTIIDPRASVCEGVVSRKGTRRYDRTCKVGGVYVYLRPLSYTPLSSSPAQFWFSPSGPKFYPLPLSSTSRHVLYADLRQHVAPALES